MAHKSVSEVSQTARDLVAAIQASPSQYHVVKNALEAIDAEILHEDDPFWDIRPGGTYAVVRNDASVIFATVPKNLVPAFACFDIVAAHTDSPSFKVKENPVVSGDGYIRLNVEEYGGTIKKTWLDRTLSVAGRVVVLEEDGSVATYLVDLGKSMNCVIPSLAPHMGAADTDEISVQGNMMPIMAVEHDLPSGQSPAELFSSVLRSALRDKYGADGEILAYDMFLYPVIDAYSLGIDDDSALGLLCMPRLDDQGCVWPAVWAFAEQAKAPERSSRVAVLALFDDEENGSMTRHGADSTFLDDVLVRLGAAIGISDAKLRSAALARSFMVSADNGHAKHPAYAGKADPTNDVVLGGGIVLKHAANQRYMTDARTAAAFKAVCSRADIPYQVFHKNSDVRGGSTLGNISTTHVSVPGVDIGLPQLAMHSSQELCHAADVRSMLLFFSAFYAGARPMSATCKEAVAY